MKHTLPIYTVQIENSAAQKFDSISAAVDYATRHVYLSPQHFDSLAAALRGGQEYTYAYGFKTVTLSASSKEIPKALIAAAPELLTILKQCAHAMSCNAPFGQPEKLPTLHEMKRAIAKAEGRKE